MVDYKFIIGLLKDVEDFSKMNNHINFSKADLGKYLIEQCNLDSSHKRDINYFGKEMGSHYVNTISNLLTSLHRYKMNYIKLALEGSIFETYDEFAFVLSLVYVGPYTPSKLIERHIQAKPTGTEIIRRLIRKELVEEYPSLEDKRSKWIKVTELGKQHFFKSMKKITKVTEMVMSPLEETEKLQLLEILQKLDKPHREVFSNQKKSDLNDLINHFNLSSIE